MQPITLTPEQLIGLVVLISGAVGFYWHRYYYLKSRLNEHIKSTANAFDLYVTTVHFLTYMNGLKKDVADGMKQIGESYHELNTRNARMEVELKWIKQQLEDRDGSQ